MRGLIKAVLFLSVVITGCAQVQPSGRVDLAPQPAARQLVVVT